MSRLDKDLAALLALRERRERKACAQVAQQTHRCAELLDEAQALQSRHAAWQGSELVQQQQQWDELLRQPISAPVVHQGQAALAACVAVGKHLLDQHQQACDAHQQGLALREQLLTEQRLRARQREALALLCKDQQRRSLRRADALADSEGGL